MSSRRSFLTQLGALTAAALPRAARGAPFAVVEAEPTIFYANPDGAARLVRFHVTGVDAPAGRLRVFDSRNRLIGTAGVLQRAGRLYGELWLPLVGDARIRSELEAPGVRGVFRTSHRIPPGRRWTVHWVTVADPARLEERLASLHAYALAAAHAVLEAAGVMGNPLTGADAPDLLDTDGLLRIAEAAGRLERRRGIPASSVAVLDPGIPVPATIVSALAGSGVRYIVERRNGGPPLRWLEGPDGARLLAAAVPTNGDSRSLAFEGPAPEMTRLVEQWLTTTPLLLAPDDAGSDDEGIAFVVDTEPPANAGRIVSQLEEWNRRYAYPRIGVGAGNELAGLYAEARATVAPVTRLESTAREALPDRAELAAIAMSRRASLERHALEAVLPLASAFRGGPVTAVSAAEALAATGPHIQTALPGTIVFNPAPFVRSDAVRFPDGSTRVVTNVPPMGYAFVVETAHHAEADAPGVDRLEASGALGRVTLDDASGAIRSIVDTDGREWVRPDVGGLNAVPGAILERWSAERIAGVGTRFRLQRWSPERGEVHTTITVYDALPWLDVENDAAALGDRSMDTFFGFALSAPDVLWEIPAGFERARPPRRRFAHTHWICLRTMDGSALVRPFDAAFATVMDDGTLVSHAPGGRSRYRLQVTRGFQDVGGCAQFGWSAEPFVAVRAEGSPTGRLPRHGSPVYVSQPGVAVVCLRPDADGTGAVVHLQELVGEERFVSLVGEILTFTEAHQVDYLGRPLGEPLRIVADSVVVRVPAWGIAAVWLGGVGVRGGWADGRIGG